MILLSTVRSDHRREYRSGVGFVKDARRINVSMTRAKHSLFIIGNAATLQAKVTYFSLVCILYREAAARVHDRYTTVT